MGISEVFESITIQHGSGIRYNTGRVFRSSMLTVGSHRDQKKRLVSRDGCTWGLTIHMKTKWFQEFYGEKNK